MIEYLPLVLTGLGLTASITYYAMVLRNQNETRQAQLFMQVYNRFSEKEFLKTCYSLQAIEWNSPEEFMKKYGPNSDPEVWSDIQYISAYFEGIGVLVKRGLLDISLMYDLISTPVLVYWETIGDIVIWRRNQLDNPRMWCWAEYLYNEIKKEKDRKQNNDA